MEDFLINTTDYKPMFPLQEFVRKTIDLCFIWVINLLIILTVIFAKIFETELGINVFENNNPQIFLVIKSSLFVLPMLIQLVEVINDHAIRKHCSKILKKTVVLDCWKQIKKIKNISFLNTIFSLTGISFAIWILFFKNNDMRIISALVAIQVSTIFIRISIFLWTLKCQQVINHKGHWTIEKTWMQITDPKYQKKFKWK